jgi:hypothetical protein
VSTKRPTAAEQAKACGMDLPTWQAARQRAQHARGRGKGRAKRPESSMWDAVDGQLDLFPVASSEDNKGGKSHG